VCVCVGVRVCMCVYVCVSMGDILDVYDAFHVPVWVLLSLDGSQLHSVQEAHKYYGVVL
jgi:hypothetical protein